MEPGSCLEKFPSPGRGSGLCALKWVRPRELLYQAEPFAYTACKRNLGSVCEHCLRTSNERLLRCSQCKVARYCGVRCQKEAWQDHKRECKSLKSIDPNFPPDSVRLVGRIVFKLRPSSQEKRLYCVFSFLSLDIDKLSDEIKEGLGHLVQALQIYLKEEIQDTSQLPPTADIFQIFAKVSGLGFYPASHPASGSLGRLTKIIETHKCKYKYKQI
uniref:[histone H3]-lysine(4) N-trimethyltransferase n=1 Tax=Sphenodon punctatus TaxID=8508 RepID=A0A8D0L7S4_SPHPU